MADPIRPRPLRLKYHSVSIIPGPKVCAQVQSLRGVRLLSLEAPRLPLVGCNCPADCTCKFQHHSDRRAGPRRAAEGGSKPGTTWAADSNRRRAPGRRDADYE
jgi:hypothetical protein